MPSWWWRTSTATSPPPAASRWKAAIRAVDEIGNPTILATFAVIASILPMGFVGGLMGPYMRPIPVGASMAMIFSLLIAFTVTPYYAYRFMKGESHADSEAEPAESRLTVFYRKVMGALLHRKPVRNSFLAGVVILLLVSCSLVYFKLVTVKMLPFDNKSELQVIIDAPDGTPLEETARIAAEMGDALRTVPEVTDFESYVGVSAPFNFNGLVRHYYLRKGPNLADIQVNFVAKADRSAQSHDIAKRIRPVLTTIADRYDARVKVAEIPPGPPVLSTLVAEVYGPDQETRVAIARQVKDIFRKTAGVVDVDWYVEDNQNKYTFAVDKEKAALERHRDRRCREDAPPGPGRDGCGAPPQARGKRAGVHQPAAAGRRQELSERPLLPSMCRRRRGTYRSPSWSRWCRGARRRASTGKI